jgi:phosphatidylserine decarboxylase
VHRDKASARITVRVRADWLNSHITYAPMAGQIDQIIWYDGQFTGFADDALPPPENARQEIALTPLHSASSEDKITICHHGAPLSRVLQSCIQEGRKVSPEMPIALGLLRPKIDISFPASYGLDIYAGQRCLAGETIIAKKEV